MFCLREVHQKINVISFYFRGKSANWFKHLLSLWYINMGLQSLKYSYTIMQMHEEKKIYCIEDIVCKLWYEITLRPKSENVNTQSMGENKLNTCWLSLNPLTPRSDWQVTSPYNNLTLSSKQVMRIFKLIGSKLLSWIWHQILNFLKNHYCFANRQVIILILVIICFCLFFKK